MLKAGEVLAAQQLIRILQATKAFGKDQTLKTRRFSNVESR